MSEKNALANVLDKAFESLSKRPKETEEQNADVMNMLPKPESQKIGNGIIVWKWPMSFCTIEGVLATRTENQMGIEKGTYVVNLCMPESQQYSYTFFDDVAKEIGSALLSAWNWQHIWKMYAGDFLLESLSEEPVKEEYTLRPPELFEPKKKAPEVIDAEQSFDAEHG